MRLLLSFFAVVALPASAGTVPFDIDVPDALFQGFESTIPIVGGPTNGGAGLLGSFAPLTNPSTCPGPLRGACLDIPSPSFLINIESLGAGSAREFTLTPPHDTRVTSVKLQGGAFGNNVAWGTPVYEVPVYPTCVPFDVSVPAASAVDVNLNAPLTITFDDPIAHLQDYGLFRAGTLVPATLSFAGGVATLTPNAPLAPTTNYVLFTRTPCGDVRSIPFRTAAAAVCGDGVVDPGEACDTVSPTTCLDIGLRDGEAVCDPVTCQVDTSACDNPVLLDLAVPEQGVACALKGDGSVTCAPQFNSTNPLFGDTGPFVSIAASKDRLCATRADDTMRCWIRNGGTYDIPLPTGAGTTFLPDDGDALYLPSADGTAIFADATLADAAPSFTRFADLSDLDVLVGSRNGDGTPGTGWMCASHLTGGFDCFQSLAAFQGATATLVPGTGALTAGFGVFTDVAAIVADGVATGCGVQSNGATTCLGSTGALARVRVPPFATSLQGVGANLLAFPTPDDPQLLVGNFNSGDRIPKGTTQVAPIALSDSLVFACWVEGSGRVDCGTNARTSNPFVPPEGAVWTDVQMSTEATFWTDDQGRVLVPIAFGDPDLRVAHDMRAVSLAGAVCGLDDAGFVRCTGGSHGMSIPDEAFVDWATSDPFSRQDPFCGIRASDATLSCTSNDGVLDPVPAGAFLDVGVVSGGVAPYDVFAVGVRADGTLACWGHPASCANAPAGSDFVHVLAGEFGSLALRADGTVSSWSRFGGPTSQVGEVLDSYSGQLGLRADGTVGSWVNAALGMPTGVFLQVVDQVYNVDAGVPGAAADGCGLRPDGTVVCWESGIGTVNVLPPLPGTYVAIAGGSGTLFALDVGGETYGFDQFLPQQPVLDVAGSSFTTCWLDLASQLQCGGNPFNGFGSYPIGATFDSLQGGPGVGLSAESFCGFGASPACFGDGILGTTPGLVPTAVDVYGGNISLCWVDATSGEVVCTGSDFSPFTPLDVPSPQASLPSRDVATNFGQTCRLRQDGELDCWGSPFAVAPPTGPFVEVLSDGVTFVAVRTDGTLVAFSAVSGAPASTPTGSFDAIDASFSRWCGVRSDGRAACWRLVGLDPSEL